MNTCFLLLSWLFYAHKILQCFALKSKFRHLRVKKKVLRGPSFVAPCLALNGVFYPVAWAQTLQQHTLEKHMDLTIGTQLETFLQPCLGICFAAMFGAGAFASGKLYRALWRTCGMFRASRRWFPSGPGLQKWKGCIEAWF